MLPGTCPSLLSRLQDHIHKPVSRIRTAVCTGPLRHRLPQVGIDQERAQRVPHPLATHLALQRDRGPGLLKVARVVGLLVACRGGQRDEYGRLAQRG